jgi:hypothetical protein
MFLSQFSQRIRDINIQDWHAKCTEMSTFCYYKNYKNGFECEQYILEVTVVKHRRALAWLRCCSHNLHVECGRRQGIERHHIVCVLCNSGEIEDEFYFTLVCNLYEQIRESYITCTCTLQPKRYMFIILMSTKKSTLVKALAAYAHHAFRMRTEALRVLHID